MTPAQQSALEAVAGRVLSPGELVALDTLLPDRKDVQIADILSAGRTRTVATPIGIGTVLAVMAPSGGDFLNAIEVLGTTDANAKWTLKLIEKGDLDVGRQDTREQLEKFATDHGGMASAIAALLAIAEQPDPIHYNTISDALNIAEGRLTL